MTERVWYWLREKGKRPQLKQATLGGIAGHTAIIMIDGERSTRNVETRHLLTTASVPLRWQHAADKAPCDCHFPRMWEPYPYECQSCMRLLPSVAGL